MSEKLFRGEYDTLVLLQCHDFPILCVIESFLDNYKLECMANGWRLPTDVMIDSHLYHAVLRELAATHNFKLSTLEDYKYVAKHARFDGIGLQPTLISQAAIERDPSIQYFFVVNYDTRSLYGV